jgi:hypothetical protein
MHECRVGSEDPETAKDRTSVVGMGQPRISPLDHRGLKPLDAQSRPVVSSWE